MKKISVPGVLILVIYKDLEFFTEFSTFLIFLLATVLTLIKYYSEDKAKLIHF